MYALQTALYSPLILQQSEASNLQYWAFVVISVIDCLYSIDTEQLLECYKNGIE